MIHFVGFLPFDDDTAVASAAVAAALAPWCGGPTRVERHEGLTVAVAAARPAPRPPPPRRFLRNVSSDVVIGGECRFTNMDDLVAQLDLPADCRAPGDVLAAAWGRWGVEAPCHLHGEFTFFVYDARAETVWLCRDDSLIRPLFFVHRPGRFIAFSNLPRPLLALGCVDPGLDDVAFAAAATITAMDTLETGYRDLRRTPWAHILTLTRDTAIKRHRWWTPMFREPPKGWSDEDYVEAARSLFDRVVRDHYGDGSERAGILLSGGLDSLAVAESVLRQKLGPLTGYAVFDPPERCVWRLRHKIADQRPVVEMFQQGHPGFKVNVIPYSTAPGDAATMERLRRVGLFSAAPHPSGMMEDARRMMKADGVTIVLGGQGGNQTLSADGWHHLDDLRHSRRWFALACEVVHFVRRRGPYMARALAGQMVPDWLWHAWRGRRRGDAPVGTDFTDFLTPEVAAAVAERYGRDKCWRVVRDTRANMLDGMRRDHPYLDGAFLPWRTLGMSLRVPLADRRIIDFALSIPADQFLRRGRTRWLIRRMLAGRLPDAILDDHRYGDDFSSFPSRAVVWRDGMRAALPGLAGSPTVRRIMDLEKMNRFIEEDWPALDPDRYARGDYGRISNFAGMVMAARFLQMTDGGNG